MAADPLLFKDLQVAANHHLLEALVESEARLRRRIDLLVEIVFELDNDGQIVFLNSAWDALIGSVSSTLIGHNFTKHIFPEDVSAFVSTLKRATQKNVASRTVIRLVSESGAIIWAEASVVRFDSGYVGAFHDITERKKAEETIKNLAFYDPLSELPNRRLLLDRLRQALTAVTRSGQTGALLFVDLDNFKILNDTLGHYMGDLLLQQVAQRLKSCIRESDTAARLGGDEFVIMLLNLSEKTTEATAQTESIARKILTALNHNYQLDTNTYRCSASIGITLFIDNKHTVDELMKQADIAMYQAKKSGRNTLRFFDRQMQENISDRASLENELQVALANQQFQLHYQIQMNSSHRPVGAEALIRWEHPKRGLVTPDQFIQQAEESGLILPIGQWVMETACAQLKAWEQDPLTHDLILSVNVSVKQLHQIDFVAQVEAIVKHYAVNPKLLMLEITESMLLENIKNVVAILSELKDVGLRFSLDDFGTGYSSLQYLKRLPIDQLKIDKSFVRDLAADSSDKAIVRTIIAMAHSLNLNVIAEGVETEDQRDFLLKTGCTHYQGYLFGTPVSSEQFKTSLK
jgi:diguanylate cyclase (GGDEF)-like protein/PAS domain S-box-containing protein